MPKASLPFSFLRPAFLQKSAQYTTPRRVLITSRPALQRRAYTPHRLVSAPSPAVLRASQVQPWRTGLLRRIRHLRKYSSPPPSAPQQSLSLSQRFKELSRKYGWAAVGVYFGLSALDFPFCFLAVRLIGTDRIAEAEHAVTHAFWRVVGTVMPSMRPARAPATGPAVEGESDSSDDEANASIWTQLLLAYGVHKSLIFFRVPLTAAVTPKIVKTLRGWGWNIGPRKAVSSTK